MENGKPRLAIFKFSSCDGCQLSLLDCEEDLLVLAGMVDIVHFLEAKRDYQPGPYDISIIEGSISTPEEIERIKAIRAETKFLFPIGVCATSGGVQSLRNWADLDDFKATVYPHPEYIECLRTSTPISDHVKVDYELQGCPPDRHELVQVLAKLLMGAKPYVRSNSVCVECKIAGNVCILVDGDMPCMGPVTHTGCGALCPKYNRDCYSCFGPMDYPNPERLGKEFEIRGYPREEIVRRFRKLYAYKEPFRRGAAIYEPQPDQR